MDSNNVLAPPRSSRDITREVGEDFVQHHFPFLATSSKGSNPSAESYLNERRSVEDFFKSESNFASTENVASTEGDHPGEDIASHNNSQFLDRLENSSVPETSVSVPTAQPINDEDFTNYEVSLSRAAFTTEGLDQHASDYDMSPSTPMFPPDAVFNEASIATESLDSLTKSFRRDPQESPGTLSPEGGTVAPCNVSTEHVFMYGDLCNSSQLFLTPSSMNGSLSNPLSDYPWLDYLNSTLVHGQSRSSNANSSYAVDLSSWWSVMPRDEKDHMAGLQGSAGSETILILKVAFLAFISVVGSVGNVMVIWSVVKERHLHRPPFYFLLSLGVTDLSRAVFCVPVVMTTVLHGSRWRHGESACKLFAFATSFFVFSSALSLLAIAIDRYICIIYSKIYRRRAPGVANLVVAIIIWIVAFSASFPPVVGAGDYIFIPDESQCGYQHKHYTLRGYLSSVFIFLAILFLTLSLYFRIFRFLRTHRRMRPLQYIPATSSNWTFVGPGANGQAFINWLNGFGGQVPVRQQRQRAVQRLNFGRVVNLSIAKNEHLTRLFLILTVAFGLLWLPYVVLSLWRIFFDASLIQSAFVTVSAGLGYVQLSLCPIVYFVARGPVKKPARTIFSHAEKNNFLLENKVVK